MEKYKKIIDIEYPKSNRRKHMSLNDRAAQFAPFAALTGYEESLKISAFIFENSSSVITC